MKHDFEFWGEGHRLTIFWGCRQRQTPGKNKGFNESSKPLHQNTDLLVLLNEVSVRTLSNG